MQQIEIPLRILCKIWTEKEEEAPDLINDFCESLTCPDLKNFSEKYLQVFLRKDTKYLPLVFELIKILEEHEDLKKHTIIVTKKAAQIIETGASAFMLPEVIIAGLAHDMGDLNGQGTEDNHVFNCVAFITNILKSHGIEGTEIIEAVSYHHKQHNHIPEKTPIIMALNAAETPYTERLKNVPVTYQEPQTVSEPEDEPIIKIDDTNIEASIKNDAGVDLVVVEEPQHVASFIPYLPPGIENPEIVDKEEILLKIIAEIDTTFSAFFFNGKVYALPKVIKRILPREKGSVENLFLVKCIQMKLSYKGAMTPQKSWYYEFEENLFPGGVPEDKKEIPRDDQGRWLKAIAPIGAQK